MSSIFGRRADKADKGETSSTSSKALVRAEPVCWPLSAQPGAEKRCALVLYGLPKFFRERSFPSLVARVISRLPFPCDVFIHTYDLRETSNARNGEVACKLDPQAVHAARPIRVAIDSQDAADLALQPLFNEMRRFGDAWFNHYVSLRNVLRQYNSLKRVRASSGVRSRCAGVPSACLTSGEPCSVRVLSTPTAGLCADGGVPGRERRAVLARLLLADGCLVPRRLGAQREPPVRGWRMSLSLRSGNAKRLRAMRHH